MSLGHLIKRILVHFLKSGSNSIAKIWKNGILCPLRILVILINTNWPLERPYYVYNAKTVFFQTHHPISTLHEKWSNPIHMQYAIIALFLKEKTQNEL